MNSVYFDITNHLSFVIHFWSSTVLALILVAYYTLLTYGDNRNLRVKAGAINILHFMFGLFLVIESFFSLSDNLRYYAIIAFVIHILGLFVILKAGKKLPRVEISIIYTLLVYMVSYSVWMVLRMVAISWFVQAFIMSFMGGILLWALYNTIKSHIKKDKSVLEKAPMMVAFMPAYIYMFFLMAIM